ncbi:MAG: hypothetical protein CM15mV123_080 [uncultured marine virus]|nr:MAG: hypothetical protein CM15mV123_080 [uncultured marine virus]
MSSDIAEAIGQGMYRNITKRSMGMDAGLSRMFSTNQREVVKTMLEEGFFKSKISLF